ncbi:MAG: DNA primase [Candidatus Nealsonbacteria bacterium]
MISSPIDEIKNRLDIADVIRGYIKIEKAGANYRAVCPFHSEKKPSFFISPSRQIWHCFGACGTGGNMFDFVMRIEGLEFGDALRVLAQKAGVELKKEDPKIKTERQHLYQISELACCFFEKQLGAGIGGNQAKQYLLDRGIKEESIKKWRLGYAPDTWQGLSDFLVSRGYQREEIEKAGLVLKSQKTGNYYDRFRGRIIFPIFDLSSQPVGFGGRIFKDAKRQDGQDEAKYINSPATPLYDKSKILYGLNKSGVEIRKEDVCILVEGYTDVILSHQSGFENTVSTSGTALTDFQLKTLKRYSDNLLTAFDMDIAGDSATKRGIDLAQRLGFDIKIVTMTKGSDPADIVSNNPDEWKKLIENSKTIHDFYFDTTLDRFDKSTLEGKKEISKLLLPIIKKIPNKIEQTIWVQSLAGNLGVKEEDILEELDKVNIDRGSMAEIGYIEKKIISPVKSRKQLLEHYLISLAIKLDKNLEIIEQDDLKLFSPETSYILSGFKEKGVSFTDNFSEEQKDLINILSLKEEMIEKEDKKEMTEKEENANLKEEFQMCLKNIKILSIKDKLNNISQQIKIAENENNQEKIQELKKEFNDISQLRCNLEIS